MDDFCVRERGMEGEEKGKARQTILLNAAQLNIYKKYAHTWRPLHNKGPGPGT